MSESSQNDLPTIFVNFRKFSEMLGKLGNPRKNFLIGGLRNFEKHSIPLHLWTEDRIQEF